MPEINPEEVLKSINQDMSDINRKEKEIRKHRIETTYEMLQRQKAEAEANKSIDLKNRDPNRVQKIVDDTVNYIEYARNSKTFLLDGFRGIVPFFKRNLILVAGKTGTGKSTLTANIAYQTISQNIKCLVISNEEVEGDCYGRVVALHKGFPYMNHSDFTREQMETIRNSIPILAKRLDVIDDNYNGHGGQTTTFEGVQAILESALTVDYGAIIIDYYQGISASKDNPSLNTWQVQEMFTNYIDQYKNRANCPIILLGQLKDDANLSFKESIEGRKTIYNKVTTALEIIPNYEDKITEWKVWKGRFSGTPGKVVKTGFEKGKYVDYDDKFAKKRLQEKEEQNYKEKFNDIFKNVFAKEIK